MKYKYSLEYSFNNGLICDSIGCNNKIQAQEIGEALFYRYDGFDNLDYIKVFDEKWNMISEINIG